MLFLQDSSHQIKKKNNESFKRPHMSELTARSVRFQEMIDTIFVYILSIIVDIKPSDHFKTC